MLFSQLYKIALYLFILVYLKMKYTIKIKNE